MLGIIVPTIIQREKRPRTTHKEIVVGKLMAASEMTSSFRDEI